MTENKLMLTFSFLIVLLFSLNFNKHWNDISYEKLKDKKYIWYWFKLFKVSETKENYIKLNKSLSVFVISIMMVLYIISVIF